MLPCFLFLWQAQCDYRWHVMNNLVDSHANLMGWLFLSDLHCRLSVKSALLSVSLSESIANSVRTVAYWSTMTRLYGHLPGDVLFRFVCVHIRVEGEHEERALLVWHTRSAGSITGSSAGCFLPPDQQCIISNTALQNLEDDVAG